MAGNFLETKFGEMYYELETRSENRKEQLAIFIHGSNKQTQKINFWSPIRSIIQSQVNAVVIDLIGHGRSKGTDIEMSFTDHVTSVKLLINHFTKKMEIRDLILIGRSYGGAIVQQLAIDIEDIASIGLIAPAGVEKYANQIKTKKISILWDVNDPIIPFKQIENYLNTNNEIKLYTLGKPNLNVNNLFYIGSDNNPSHEPELQSPELFTRFLKSLIE
ncbi:MAG: lysophospholipase [Candidatus Heimdallarchaeota archaeon]|nr:lysophospholipase [Candidatus Heimdallarchaeota archaeon]